MADPESGVGVIYLGWHGETAGRPASRSVWKAFAEAKCGDWNGARGVLVGRQWMNDDLFLYVRGSGEPGESPDEWLLDLSRRLRSEWEEQFRRECRDYHPFAARLHAGVASSGALAGADLDAGGWYDLLKRALIHGQAADAPERSLQRMAFRRLLDEGSIEPVYQPILSLEDEAVFGFEALTRVRDNEWFERPLQLFQFAEEEGELYEIGRASCRERV